jgi:WD40 repeat protein
MLSISISFLFPKMNLLQKLSEHKDKVWQAAWCPTMLEFASCSTDKSIKIYNMVNNQFVMTKSIPDAHTRTIRSVSYNPNGKILASCSFDSTTSIYDKSVDFDQIAILEGHENEVKQVCWSASGELLATCSRDKSVWIWECLADAEFECVAVLHEHSQDVKTIKFHPNKEILVSAGYDDTIKIWKGEDEDWFCASTLTGHHSTVWELDFDTTGDYLGIKTIDKYLFPMICLYGCGKRKMILMFRNLLLKSYIREQSILSLGQNIMV